MHAKLVWYVKRLLPLLLWFAIVYENEAANLEISQIHLAKSLAVEWAKWGGRINSVSPGYIDTAISGDCPFEMKEEWYSLTPLRRDADPRELKGIYLYLASDASSYTTGADFSIDGGYTAR